MGNHRRRDAVRRHAVCTDSIGAQFRGEVAGKTHDRVLGGSIGGRCKTTGDSRDTGHADDGTGAGLLHHPRGVLHAVEHAVQQDVQREFPFLSWGGLDRPDRADDPRVIEHDVQLAVALDGRLHQSLDVALTSDIADLETGCRPEARGHRVTGLLLDVAEDHIGAFGHQLGSSRCADAARATGDDRHFTFDSSTHGQSPSRY